MVVSSANNLISNEKDLLSLDIGESSAKKLRAIKNVGQIHIFKSSYRGSYSTIIRDSLRNSAIGRKVLLVQLMKGGVNQGIGNPVKLCGNLTWIRASDSYDKYDSDSLNNSEILTSIKGAILELWDFCKKQLLSGSKDQIILDEIFRAVDLQIIQKDDLISTLENRLISGDVILTGTSIPKDFLIMADQVTELRS